MTEANSKMMINKLLSDADWHLPGSESTVNVKSEVQNSAGFADYVLFDDDDLNSNFSTSVTLTTGFTHSISFKVEPLTTSSHIGIK